jgi:hypothetical protein
MGFDLHGDSLSGRKIPPAAGIRHSIAGAIMLTLGLVAQLSARHGNNRLGDSCWERSSF